MIDFILSKLGILLFAVSMAGILIYFSISIKDVFLSDETIQISNIMAKQIKYMAESENLCASTKVILPRYIDIFGVSDNASFSSIYYYMDINVVSSQSSDEKFVVFSIFNKQTKKQIALESFRTKSEVILTDSSNNAATGISIDPTLQSVVYMIKSKSFDNGEKTNIYFINCKYDPNKVVSVETQDNCESSPFEDCYKKINVLKQNLKNNNGNYPFFCVPGCK
jgi:hypothetical protein